MFKKLFKALGREQDPQTGNVGISGEQMQNQTDAYVDVFKTYLDTHDASLDTPSIQSVFLQEAQRLLAQLVVAVEAWKKHPRSESYLRETYRYLYALKGDANLVNFFQIGNMAHNIEAYIEESIKEDVLGDRAFFLGIERQLKALEKALSIQIQKYIKNSAQNFINTARDPNLQQAFSDSHQESYDIPSDVTQYAPHLTQTRPMAIDIEQVAILKHVGFEEEFLSAQENTNDFDNNTTKNSVLDQDNYLVLDELPEQAITQIQASATLEKKLAESQRIAAEQALQQAAQQALEKKQRILAERAQHEEQLKQFALAQKEQQSVQQEQIQEHLRTQKQQQQDAKTHTDDAKITEKPTLNLDVSIEKNNTDLKRRSYVTEIDILEGYQSKKVDELFKAENKLLAKYNQLENSLQPYMGDASSNAQALKNAFEEINKQHKYLADGLHELDISLKQQRQINVNLQSEFSSTTYYPFGKLIPMLETLHQQTTKELNKSVALNISGSDVQVSENLAQRFSVMLGHLLRNAISHGVESSAVRLANNKLAQGNIRVSLESENNTFVLTIEDDGQGVDVATISASSVNTNLLQQKNLTQEKIIASIFSSGLSASQHISHISGRGIGLDVVRHEVEKLNGHISVFTERFVGTRFVIEVPNPPQSMHILPILQSGFEYGLPQQDVVTVITHVADVNVLGHANQLRVEYAGATYPYFSLAYLLFNENLSAPTAQQKILLIKSSTQIYAVSVDKILAPIQVSLRRTTAISGKSPWVLAFAANDLNEALPVLNTRALAYAQQESKLVTVYTYLKSAPLPQVPAAPIINSVNATVAQVKTPVFEHQQTHVEKYSVVTESASLDSAQIFIPTLTTREPLFVGEALLQTDSNVQSRAATRSALLESVVVPSMSGASVSAQKNMPQTTATIVATQQEVVVTDNMSEASEVAQKHIQVTPKNMSQVKKVHGAVTIILDDDDSAQPLVPDPNTKLSASHTLNKNKNLRVLLVNLHADDAQSFITYLQQQSLQWQPHVTNQPLEYLKQQDIDVVLLSSAANEAVNLDVLIELRKNIKYRRLPVIVATKLTSDIYRQRAYILGANYVLHRPYSFLQLREVIDMVAMQVTVVEDIHGTP